MRYSRRVIGVLAILVAGAPLPAAANLRAHLECAGELEIVAGGKPEICTVWVRGWRTDTAAPVQVTFDPPLPGVRVTLENRSLDRAAFRFPHAFAAEGGTERTDVNTTVVVRQGDAEVRMPLAIHVVPPGWPPGISLDPLEPFLRYSRERMPGLPGGGGPPDPAGPYCVWQYKLFGDPAGCWHVVAATCGDPPYSSRAEYVPAGADFHRSEVEAAIKRLTRNSEDAACLAANKGRDPWMPVPDDGEVMPPPPQLIPPDVTPTARLTRFGISPRDMSMRVGQTERFRAYGTFSDAPDKVIEIHSVTWSGDLTSPNFTAAPHHVGRALQLTATTPEGFSDTIWIRVGGEER
jgi:hypothetical protein